MSEKFNRQPSQNPPCGLKPENIPQLVAFTFDDNTYSGLPGSGAEGGMKFIVDTLTSRKNPAGNNAECFDGTQVAGTFYLKGNNACENPFEDDSLVKKSWREAYEKGCEIGTHTYSHPHGMEYDWDANPAKRIPIIDVQGWTDEINKCLDVITKPWNPDVKEHETQYGIGVDRKDIIGHRTPFLEFNDHAYTALQNLGFEYEAAVEEGWQDDQDGSNFLWPYTLDNGCEGDKWVSEYFYDGSKPLIGKHPGLWCLPCYAIVVPPDEKCEEYGTTVGARARMKKEVDSFDESTGKITGLDWNIWFEYYMTAEDALATLKYSFDLRYNGNRCPWPIGFHSDIYSSKYDINDLEGDDPAKIRANAEHRREVVIKLVDYILSKPDARIVTAKDMLNWIKNPKALR